MSTGHWGLAALAYDGRRDLCFVDINDGMEDLAGVRSVEVEVHVGLLVKPSQMRKGLG